MITLRPETLNQICEHAKSEFPDECCGAILSDGVQESVWKCRNIQNKLHREDPDTYPRDARTAYVIHPDDLFAVTKASETQQIKAFYHSHPNHEAYFSEKDKARCRRCGMNRPIRGRPTWLSLSTGPRVPAVKAFAWDETSRDFVEVEGPLVNT